MKIKTLGIWKNITVWGGFLIAIVGASYALSLGKLDIVSGSLTYGGLAFTCIGNLIGVAQSKRQQEEKEALQKRLAGMDRRIKEAYDKPATFG